MRSSREINNEPNAVITSFRQCNGIEASSVLVNGRTLIDNSDMRSTMFTITDKFGYYKEKNAFH